MFLAQNPRCDDKIHLIEELASAGVCPLAEYCDELPTWQQVTELYGDKPVVLGLETCDAYKTLLNGSAPMPKLAGLWNTGSTALPKTFLHNMLLYDAHWTIDRANVPWGKVRVQELVDLLSVCVVLTHDFAFHPQHTPLSLKYKNTYPLGNPDDRDQILVVVVIRDPMRWMDSMVRTRNVCDTGRSTFAYPRSFAVPQGLRS